MAWPEFDKLDANKTTSFRVALEKDAPPRLQIDPRLWNLTGLTSLDLSGIGLRRLDHLAPETARDADNEEADVEPHVGDAISVASVGAGLGLRCLARLRDLSLNANALGPALYPEGALHGLTALRSLDLQRNGLEMLPPAIVSLESLTSLNVSCNSLAALPWTSLSLLPELRSLAVAFNLLRSLENGEGGMAVGVPPHLAELTLRSNRLVGDAGLSVLAQSTTLASLDVADNELTSLPSDIAISCSKLSRLVISGNRWEDKKLSKLADGQTEQAPAKAILELLRKGQSKRQLKAEQQQNPKPKPAPPRLYRLEPQAATGVAGKPSEGDAVEQVGKKKGKSKTAVSTTPAAVEATSTRKCVTISRNALGVRPHILMAVLHVAVDDDAPGENGGSHQPFFFFAEGPKTMSRRSFEDAFEGQLGLMERGLGVPSAVDDEVGAAVQTATARLQAFVAAQTRIHGAAELGNKRRAGALGSHSATAVNWPLKFDASSHDKVRFAPLAIGWMESKGIVSVADYAGDAAKGRLAGVAKDVASALQKPAMDLLALPLCPHTVDANGVVLSVHPLSNGWETRTLADTRGAVVLECSSAQSEDRCRKMLLALIRDVINMVEGNGAGPEADAERLQHRRVRVLVEPVDVVYDWDRKNRRAEFPDYDELMALPPLPAYCGADCVARASPSGADRASNGSSSSGSSDGSSTSSDESDAESKNDGKKCNGAGTQQGYPQRQPKGRGKGNGQKKK